MFSGILKLIKPVEHQFDNRNKSYLSNNKLISRFDEIEDTQIRRRTRVSNGHTSRWYELYLVIRSCEPVKLMKTNLEDYAITLRMR